MNKDEILEQIEDIKGMVEDLHREFVRDIDNSIDGIEDELERLIDDIKSSSNEWSEDKEGE